MNKIHSMKSINATETHLHLIIDDNADRIRWEDCSPKLAHASLPQKKRVDVAPSGHGIHWPEIDEDLAITPQLKLAERLELETAG